MIAIGSHNVITYHFVGYKSATHTEINYFKLYLHNIKYLMKSCVYYDKPLINTEFPFLRL